MSLRESTGSGEVTVLNCTVVEPSELDENRETHAPKAEEG